MICVCVHGIFDTGAVFRPLRRYLAKRGHRVLAPDLRPKDGRGGLERLAGQLESFIEAETEGASFVVIAFSMGGIIARVLLRNEKWHDRCVSLMTISSPHHGSYWGFAYPSMGAREMRPGSAFLAELNAPEALTTYERIPAVSYWTPLDLTIIPATSSIITWGESVRLWAPCHPCMLLYFPLWKDLLGRIDRWETTEWAASLRGHPPR